jgi:hypothetical protein
MDEEQIFQAAIGLATPAAREEFLQSACGGDHDLRARIERLLAAHEQPDSFFQQPPVLGLARTWG